MVTNNNIETSNATLGNGKLGNNNIETNNVKLGNGYNKI